MRFHSCVTWPAVCNSCLSYFCFTHISFSTLVTHGHGLLLTLRQPWFEAFGFAWQLDHKMMQNEALSYKWEWRGFYFWSKIQWNLPNMVTPQCFLVVRGPCVCVFVFLCVLSKFSFGSWSFKYCFATHYNPLRLALADLLLQHGLNSTAFGWKIYYTDMKPCVWASSQISIPVCAVSGSQNYVFFVLL